MQSKPSPRNSGPSSTSASAQHWLFGLLIPSKAPNSNYFLPCKQPLQDACSDRPCLLHRHVSGAGWLCFQFLRKGVVINCSRGSFRQRQGQEGRHRVVVPVLLTQPGCTLGDSGGCSRGSASSKSSFPSSSCQAASCRQEWGWYNTGYALGSAKCTQLAPIPFPRIPAVTPLLGKPASPEAWSHLSPWHTAPAPCPGRHPAPGTALAG